MSMQVPHSVAVSQVAVAACVFCGDGAPSISLGAAGLAELEPQAAAKQKRASDKDFMRIVIDGPRTRVKPWVRYVFTLVSMRLAAPPKRLAG